jgi:hypothetical protein
MIENTSRFSQMGTEIWRFKSPGSLRSVDFSFRKVQHFKKFRLLDPEDGGTRLLRYVGNYSPVDTHNIQEDSNLQHRREESKARKDTIGSSETLLAMYCTKRYGIISKKVTIPYCYCTLGYQSLSKHYMFGEQFVKRQKFYKCKQGTLSRCKQLRQHDYSHCDVFSVYGESLLTCFSYTTDLVLPSTETKTRRVGKDGLKRVRRKSGIRSLSGNKTRRT